MNRIGQLDDVINAFMRACVSVCVCTCFACACVRLYPCACVCARAYVCVLYTHICVSSLDWCVLPVLHIY